MAIGQYSMIDLLRVIEDYGLSESEGMSLIKSYYDDYPLTKDDLYGITAMAISWAIAGEVKKVIDKVLEDQDGMAKVQKKKSRK